MPAARKKKRPPPTAAWAAAKKKREAEAIAREAAAAEDTETVADEELAVEQQPPPPMTADQIATALEAEGLMLLPSRREGAKTGYKGVYSTGDMQVICICICPMSPSCEGMGETSCWENLRRRRRQLSPMPAQSVLPRSKGVPLLFTHVL